MALIGVVAFVPEEWWPKCPIHAVTGLWCPGCGGQRALHAVLRGDLETAVAQNALVFALPAFVLAGFFAENSRRPLWNRLVVGLVVTVTALFTIVRNLPGSPLAPF